MVRKYETALAHTLRSPECSTPSTPTNGNQGHHRVLTKVLYDAGAETNRRSAMIGHRS